MNFFRTDKVSMTIKKYIFLKRVTGLEMIYWLLRPDGLVKIALMGGMQFLKFTYYLKEINQMFTFLALFTLFGKNITSKFDKVWNFSFLHVRQNKD